MHIDFKNSENNSDFGAEKHDMLRDMLRDELHETHRKYQQETNSASK